MVRSVIKLAAVAALRQPQRARRPACRALALAADDDAAGAAMAQSGRPHRVLAVMAARCGRQHWLVMAEDAAVAVMGIGPAAADQLQGQLRFRRQFLQADIRRLRQVAAGQHEGGKDCCDGQLHAGCASLPAWK